MLISYVFSFRNEAQNINELVSRVDKSTNILKDISYEMIFVNDKSTDNSLEILLDLQKKYPITIINMSRRFGVTPCIIAGLGYTKGEAIIYMDADLQDPPELVPKLIERYKNGADVVHTTRTKREGEGFFKLWLTKRAYKAINLFSDISLPENTGDFKLLSRKVVDHLLSLKEYDPYMRGLSIWVGFNQDFVFYTREARFAGKSKFPIFSTGPTKEFIRGLTAYSASPLYLSFFIGLFTSIISLGLIIYALISKFLGIASDGSTGILIAISFFSGVILMTNGILGIYLAKIYYEVKGRPRFIVDEVLYKK